MSTATDDHARPPLSVMARMGCLPDLADDTRGHVAVTPEICHGGHVRPAALMLLADTVVGVRLESQLADWTFTTDFSLRRAGSAAPGTVVHAVSRPLRHGRRLIVEAVELNDGTGGCVAHTQISFLRTPVRDGDVKPDMAAIRRAWAEVVIPPLDQPVADAAGIEVLDPRSGRVRLLPREDLMRPGGMVQGGVMTLIGEVSALTLAETDLERTCVVTDLDVRYLLGGRVGPLTATATWVGPLGTGAIAVELRDEGHAGDLTTTFLARVAPAEG